MDSLWHILRTIGQIWYIATIKSSVQVGILTPWWKLRHCKHPCLYYSNSFATFHCTLEADLVFKSNPGPLNNGGQSTIQMCCSCRCQALLSAHLSTTTQENNYYSSIPVRTTTRSLLEVSNFSKRNLENLVSISPSHVPNMHYCLPSVRFGLWNAHSIRNNKTTL